jgi:anti-anti-sigma regulatory factor/anti-sigma regulatory factor (Ser/Thr protein kinase)
MSRADRVECVAELRFPVSVVRVTGTLDLPGATTVRGFLLTCLAEQPVALVVDLSGLTVSDDLALILLPAMGRRAAEWPGTELLLCAPDAEVVDALDRIGVTRYLRVFGARQEALTVAARQPTPRRLRQHLRAGVDAPRQARELIARIGFTWRLPTEAQQVAQVIATELVSNAVLHARTPIDFSLLLRERYLHVAVQDADPALPRRHISSEHDDHGRGLQVVDGLAASWGCVPTVDGKVVWATVRVRPENWRYDGHR